MEYLFITILHHRRVRQRIPKKKRIFQSRPLRFGVRKLKYPPTSLSFLSLYSVYPCEKCKLPLFFATQPKKSRTLSPLRPPEQQCASQSPPPQGNNNVFRFRLQICHRASIVVREEQMRRRGTKIQQGNPRKRPCRDARTKNSNPKRLLGEIRDALAKQGWPTSASAV